MVCATVLSGNFRNDWTMDANEHGIAVRNQEVHVTTNFESVGQLVSSRHCGRRISLLPFTIAARRRLQECFRLLFHRRHCQHDCFSITVVANSICLAAARKCISFLTSEHPLSSLPPPANRGGSASRV